MDEQQKALLEGINALKKNIIENVEKRQEELRNNLEKKIEQVEERYERFVPAALVPVPSSPVSVKLYTYEEKTNWEVYTTQFGKISESNGWTEGVKACQLAASLRGEAAEILQTLPDIERLNLNSLYNALDLRFGQKFSKDYARLQMKTRHQKPEESLQDYAFEMQRLTTSAFSDFSANV
ncbi:uncharacterized protein TNCV_4423651 [Trichonephila clavipes]|nr:uncharacterized protein TNCV_4423651 [Trichonephila clavipes]